MASTDYRNNVRSINIGGWQFGFDVRTEYDNVTRSNNTITIHNLRTRMRVNSNSVGATFTGTTVQVHTDSPSGTRRRNASLGSGTFARGSSYLGSGGNYSFGVSSGASVVSTRSGVSVNGGPSFGGAQNISIPTVSAPSGNTNLQSGTTTSSIRVRNDVTNWGNNVSSGSVRSYIADNSGFSGQTYIGTSDNALVTHTGLDSNRRYWLRGWANNGAGLSSYMNTVNTYTLPLAPNTTSVTPEATSVAVSTTQNNGGGALTITRSYRVREAGGSWGSWTNYSGNDFTVDGLLPSTDYEVQVRSTTSAGTSEGSVTSFTTMPAAKLIMPDGTVVNAIPRVIYPDGTSEMRKVQIIQP